MIEAVVEDQAVKEAIFREADAVLARGAILASNTSSIPIASLAAVTGRPDKVIGMHFFNPVPVMALVEVVSTKETSADTPAAVVELAQELGKTPPKRTTSRLRLEQDPSALHQRGRLGAPRRRRRSGGDRHDRQARASTTRWGRWLSPI
jgi:hypothetical protein